MQTQDERYLWLLSRKLSGSITEDENKELESLAGAEPRLRKESEAMQAFWAHGAGGQHNDGTQQAFEQLKARMYAEDPQLWPEEEKRSGGGKWRRLLLRSAAAAVLLGGATYLLAKTGILPWQDGLTADYNVRGTRSHIKLADGTSVWLNSDSELKYPRRFKGGSREVYLKGEAFFDVAKDAEKPFVVHTETMHVNVLGTSFNIRAYPEDSVCEATLITGEVMVELKNSPEKKIRLRPAEKLVVPNHGDSAVKYPTGLQPVIMKPTYSLKADSAIIETAWVDNRLIFQDETFATLASRMERWYNVSIRFENAAIQQLRFTGIFGKEQLPQALQALQLTEHFNYSITDDTVTIY
ncbi:FecR family protein [Chitinophaga sp. GCM10012297]|uniref:FecR domain-containing protein n=1 Tax=Chitinophaga chungangae TaxID=2821488 RepID=A0ABS3YHV0_9BACT|nr:FecR domain-containing protein [Chitinophaga chungangae]MBO9154265.1 FecR domain-containing protein [Chitinophaga chungangae]